LPTTQSHHIARRASRATYRNSSSTDIDRLTTSPTAIFRVSATYEVAATGETSLRFT
jgi:hypothetical protein